MVLFLLGAVAHLTCLLTDALMLGEFLAVLTFILHCLLLSKSPGGHQTESSKS